MINKMKLFFEQLLPSNLFFLFEAFTVSGLSVPRVTVISPLILRPHIMKIEEMQQLRKHYHHFYPDTLLVSLAESSQYFVDERLCGIHAEILTSFE